MEKLGIIMEETMEEVLCPQSIRSSIRIGHITFAPTANVSSQLWLSELGKLRRRLGVGVLMSSTRNAQKTGEKSVENRGWSNPPSSLYAT